MKKLILLELELLFLATTFQSNPLGWYEVTLPVNDFVNDIFFLDSLTGWVATNSDGSANDTAYIMKTTDGGSNWIIQEKSKYLYQRIQFLNVQTGFLTGSTGAAVVWKTTNGGTNWFELFNFGLAFAINDIQFLNEDTGWVSSVDFWLGGIWKTIDGGMNWTRQLTPPNFPIVKIKAISILNKDTGWAINDGDNKELYRTTNGGANWDIQFVFSDPLQDIYFLNDSVGIISKAPMGRTTNGGFDWTNSSTLVGGIDLIFVSDSVGWGGQDILKVAKTTTGGVIWFYQSSPIATNTSVYAYDTLLAWAAGSGMVRTTTGGITSIHNNFANFSKSFLLFQNFPNPFNPKTKISYELNKPTYVLLKIFDIQGKEISTLVNQNQNSGRYEVEFNSNEKQISSGIYFYRIETHDLEKNNFYAETKTMVFLK